MLEQCHFLQHEVLTGNVLWWSLRIGRGIYRHPGAGCCFPCGAPAFPASGGSPGHLALNDTTQISSVGYLMFLPENEVVVAVPRDQWDRMY